MLRNSTKTDFSYPGEMPDLDLQTISLRTQLRLSYETYAWLRYLTWTGLALLGILLLLLPGGFPPQIFLLFLQTLPLTGRLLALHGPAALFSLATLGIQALTLLVLWGLWIAFVHALGRYTWRLSRSRSLLGSGWQSSSALADGQAQRGKLVPASLAQTAPLKPSFTPAGRVQSAAPVNPVNRSISSPSVSAPHGSQQQARQFAQPTVPLVRRAPLPSGEFTFAWPASSTAGAPGVAWDVGITRQGRPNEDSVLALRGTCNFAGGLRPFELHIVADGMGGHAHGRLASHLALRGMLETVVPGLIACSELENEGIVDILIDGVHWANQVIYQHGREQGAEMGTTITAVLLLNETAYIINVGDSRTYIYRPNAGLTQITRDHSLVARLVESGAISPDEVYTHPDRNKVYRGLGDKIDVTVDWFVLPVQNGDLLLLCSDGLWEMVRDQQMTEILTTYAGAPALASNALLRAALQAGGNDNVSALVVRV